MRIALVHDYVVRLRGGERIYLALARMFPDADCFALVGGRRWLPTEAHAPRIRVSPLRFVPGSAAYYRSLLPLYPIVARNLDLRDYDVVISSSSGFCHAARVAGKHLCYCHTPLRYAWTEYEATIASQQSRLKRAALGWTLRYARRADYAAAQRVTRYVANSTAVQQRIARFYGRTSTVVHPFIDVAHFRPSQPAARRGRRAFFLTVSQLLPYKRVDLAVEACTRLGMPLVVVGTGPELPHLKSIAGPTVRFVGWVSREELARLYAECDAFVQCGEEDFGISALEAQASGRPVIAYGASGALDTVRDGITGRLFFAQSADTLADTLRAFDADQFDAAAIRAHAERFDEAHFREGITREVSALLSVQSSTAAEDSGDSRLIASLDGRL